MLNPDNPSQSTIDDVQRFILELTNRYAGVQKNIVDKPIIMNIFSPFKEANGEMRQAQIFSFRWSVSRRDSVTLLFSLSVGPWWWTDR